MDNDLEFIKSELQNTLSNEHNRIKKTISLNVGMLRSFSQLIDSKEYFMICELIDNSISSWLSKNVTSEGLIVEINYTRAKEVKQNRLIVIDNAYGINDNTMVYALTPGSIQNKSTDFNIYGMGLKQAAFWSGNRLEIYTKQENDTEISYAYIDLDDAEKEKDGSVNFIQEKILNKKIEYIYKFSWYQHGTIVQISNLKDNHYSKIPELVSEYKKINSNNQNSFYSESIKDPVITAVILKYQRYVEEGMKIVFSYRNELDNMKDDYYEISAFDFQIESENPWNTIWTESARKFSNDLKIRLQYSSDFDNYMKDNIKNIIKVAEKNKYYKSENLNDYYKMINLKQPLFETMIMEIPGIEPVNINIGYMSFDYEKNNKKSFYTRFRGMTVFQSNRAICCGPNERSGNLKKAEIGNFSIKSEGEITRDNDFGYRRIYGNFDIDSLINGGLLSLDTNKKNFRQREDSTKTFSKYFDEIVNRFVKKWSPLFKAIEEWLAENKNIQVDSKEILKNNISNAMVNTKINLVKDETNNEFIEVNLSSIDEKCSEVLKFYIKEMSDNPVIDALTLNDDNDIYTIDLNVNSHMWKPILPSLDAETKKDAKAKFMQTIYKIVVAQVGTSIVLNKGRAYEQIEENNDFTFLYEKFDKDYIKIFNEFSKLLS